MADTCPECGALYEDGLEACPYCNPPGENCTEENGNVQTQQKTDKISCPGCGKKYSVLLAQCPFCSEKRPGFSKDRYLKAQAAAASSDISETLRSDVKHFTLPASVHALLLILAIPVLAPSLILTFITAKKWGRIPYVWILVNGLILILFSMRSPWLMSLFITSTEE